LRKVTKSRATDFSSDEIYGKLAAFGLDAGTLFRSLTAPNFSVIRFLAVMEKWMFPQLAV
jgi:hypothetical protein